MRSVCSCSGIGRAGLILFLLLLAAGGGLAKNSPATSSGVVLNPANGHWYELVEDDLPWVEANSQAQSRLHNGRPGHLATVTTLAEDEFIRSAFPAAVSAGCYLGGFQPRGSAEPGANWKWVSGEAWSYSRWTRNQPGDGGNGESRLTLTTGGWDDTSPGNRRAGYVVEYEPSPSTGAPGAPGDFRALTLSGAVGLYWIDASYNEHSFEIERLNAGGFAVIARLPAGSWFYIDDVAPPYGVPHTYRVRALNDAGGSPYSELRSALAALPTYLSYGDGHSYNFTACGDAIPWELARIAASSRVVNERPGHLATITDKAEADRFRSSPILPRLGWLGGVRDGDSSGWRWITDEPWDFTFWAPGMPDNQGGDEDAIHIFDTLGRWGDLSPTGESIGAYWLEHDEFHLAATPKAPTQIQLAWEDRVSRETGWAVERRSGDEEFAVVGTAGPNTAAHLDTGLIPGTVYDYRVRAQVSGGQVYSREARVQAGAPTSFTAGLSYPAGVRVHHLDTADFDRDGRLDLVSFGDGDARLHFGIGDGALSPVVSFSMGAPAMAEWAEIRGADLDGDGYPELIAAIAAADVLVVRRNLGNRAFGSPQVYPTGDLPRGLVLKDLNSDGSTDVAVANQGSRNLSIHLNRRDGTFSPAVFYEGSGGYPVAITSGDYNGDGSWDLAMSHHASYDIRIFQGNGMGGFALLADVTTGPYIDALISADFSGDGRDDLAVANPVENSVAVLINNGGGAFAAPEHYCTNRLPSSLQAADFNRDGDMDIGVTPLLGERYQVLPNEGDGTFSNALTFLASPDATPAAFLTTRRDLGAAAVGDFNGDGLPDIAASNYSRPEVVTYLNTSIGSSAALPAAPSGLSATANTADIELRWTDNSTNEIDFEVERKTTGAFSLVAEAPPAASSGTQVSFIDTLTLAPQETYTYRVRAKGIGGHSTYSNPATAATGAGFPAAPHGLIATAHSPDRIDLTWVDASANETGFKIERKDYFGGFTQLAVVAAVEGSGSLVHFQDTTGIAPGITFTYRVRASSSSGDSGYSNEVAAATSMSPPAPPANLRAMAISSSRVDLAWDDQSTDEAGFTIERRSNGGEFSLLATLPGDVESYSDQNVASQSTYTYRVSAANEGGASGYTNEATITTPIGATGAPTQLTAVALSSSAVLLGWRDNSDNELEFRIERRSSGGVFAQVATRAPQPGSGAIITSQDTAGLTPNATFVYLVRAAGPLGVSDYSNEVQVTTTPQLPAAPSGLGASLSAPATVRLTWTDNSNIETGFSIERKSGVNGNFTAIAAAAANSVSYDDLGLALDTNYLYRVRAVGAAGSSTFSNEAATATPPTPPANVTAVVGGPGQVLVAWTDTSQSETGFKVERKNGTAFAVIGNPAAGVTGFTDGGLAAGTTYVYRVRATNQGGDSTPSNEAARLTLPAVPVALAASAVSSTQLRLTWTDGNPSPPPVKVERSASQSGPFALVGTSPGGGTSFQDSGLEGNVVYYYRVRASNASGDSDYSTVASGTTLPTPPAAPSSFAASAVGARSVLLSWRDNSNSETGFELWRLSPAGAAYQLVTTAAADSISYLDTTAAGNSTYLYRLRAVNAGGGSAYISAAPVGTPPDLPAKPGGLSATSIDSGLLRLSWSDLSDNETGFVIERKHGLSSFSVITTVGAGSVQYFDGGLLEATSYTYRLKTVNTQGASDYTNEFSGITLPQSPGDLTATSGPRRIMLTWRDRSNGETGYQIDRKSGGGAFTPVKNLGAGATAYTDSDVAAGVEYTYRVRASGAGGASAHSGEASASAIAASPLAKLVVNPARLNFGSVRLGAAKPKTVRFTNKGKEPLTVSLGQLDGPFSGPNSMNFTLAPRQQRTVSVVFTPNAPGAATAVLKVYSTDPRAIQKDVSCVGKGR